MGRSLLQPGQHAPPGDPAEAGVEAHLDVIEPGIDQTIGAQPGTEMILAGVGGEGGASDKQQGKNKAHDLWGAGKGSGPHAAAPELRNRALALF